MINFKTKIFVLFFFPAFLSSCSLTMSPKERALAAEADRLETLVYYDDNRIGLATAEDPLQGAILVNSKADEVLGVSINGNIFNLLDVKEIFGSGGYLRVMLNSGKVVDAIDQYYDPQKTKIDRRSPAIVQCDAERKCKYRFQSDKMNIDDGLTFNSFRPLGKLNFEPQLFSSDGYGVEKIPRKGKYTLYPVEFKSVSEIQDKYNQRALAEQKAYKEREEQTRQQEAQIKNQQREAAERAQAQSQKLTNEMRKSIKTGTRTNCGLVISVNRPLALVETHVGQKHLEIDSLFHSGESCRFINGTYVGK